MFISIAVLAAFLCSRLLGTDLYTATVFGAVGLLLARLLFSERIRLAPYPLFVLLLLFGTATEILSTLKGKSIYEGNLYAAWFLFLPSLFFLFYSPWIKGTARKLVAIAYCTLLMLLYIYAEKNIGTAADYCFLPMQLGLLFTVLFPRKQKNDA